jgi:dihydroorotate dehydrogenase
MDKIKTAVTAKQLEINWSSPQVPEWSQLTLDVRRETTRLLGEMLVEAATKARENEEKKGRESDE